jgi:hypothetical protein
MGKGAFPFLSMNDLSISEVEFTCLVSISEEECKFFKKEFTQLDLQGAIVHSSSEIDRNHLKGKRGKITLQEECSFRVYSI